MARRIRLDLMDASHTPQTGNGTAQDWPGGEGLLSVESATFGGGSVALQIQGPGGAWVPLNHRGTATAIAIAAVGSAYFSAPAGPIRVVATTATAVVCNVCGIPTNSAG